MSKPALLILKGDIVRTSSGATGEVTDIWGVARPWAKLRKENGELLFFLRTDVAEIISRPKAVKASKSVRGRR